MWISTKISPSHPSNQEYWGITLLVPSLSPRQLMRHLSIIWSCGAKKTIVHLFNAHIVRFFCARNRHRIFGDCQEVKMRWNLRNEKPGYYETVHKFVTIPSSDQVWMTKVRYETQLLALHLLNRLLGPRPLRFCCSFSLSNFSSSIFRRSASFSLTVKCSAGAPNGNTVKPHLEHIARGPISYP